MTRSLFCVRKVDKSIFGDLNKVWWSVTETPKTSPWDDCREGSPYYPLLGLLGSRRPTLRTVGASKSQSLLVTGGVDGSSFPSVPLTYYPEDSTQGCLLRRSFLSRFIVYDLHVVRGRVGPSRSLLFHSRPRPLSAGTQIRVKTVNRRHVEPLQWIRETGGRG